MKTELFKHKEFFQTWSRIYSNCALIYMYKRSFEDTLTTIFLDSHGDRIFYANVDINSYHTFYFRKYELK